MKRTIKNTIMAITLSAVSLFGVTTFANAQQNEQKQQKQQKQQQRAAERQANQQKQERQQQRAQQQQQRSPDCIVQLHYLTMPTAFIVAPRSASDLAMNFANSSGGA